MEKKEGRLKGHKDVIIQDLPGIYSLSPYTLEEVVARNYLVGEQPDAILNIVDGTNIERNLYLTTQLIELGLPVVVAVNMMDLVRKNGDRIDVKKLSAALGCTVLEISALKGEGSTAAAEKAMDLARSQRSGELPHVFTGSVEHAIAHIEESIQGKVDDRYLRWYAIKLFERDEKVLAELKLDEALKAHLENHIQGCEQELDDDAESIITNQRYAYISGVVEKSVQKGRARHDLTVSDKIDRVVTNRILALPIFAAVMFLVYWIAMGPFGSFLTDWTNDVLGGEWLTGGSRSVLESWGCAEWLTGLVSDGIVAGVGAVLGFVPQMLVLFLMLALLEDVGYMARVAFIMDRIFRKFGLSGKSFIPMLIGSGCGVPGVMASRTIENERDRRMTIMTTCFIPCGAKMPIIGLFAGAIFGGSGLVAVSAYFIGVAAIVISGILLKKTKGFAGDPAPFVMELPAYHTPAAGNVLRATWERGWSFIKRAGTVIVASSIILWFLQGFGFTESGFGMVEDNNSSLLAAIGGAVCVIFAPLGFGNWQSTVATVTGLIAKENVVSTFGVLFGLGTDLAEDDPGLQASIATGYMCGFAYLVSLIIYQLGGLVTGEVSFGIGTVAGVLALVFLGYLLVRRNKHEEGWLNVNAVQAAGVKAAK